MSWGCVYFHVEGCQHLLKGIILSRLEEVRTETNSSLWVTACALEGQLVLALLYFISIFPSWLPSLWTSNCSIVYKDCFTISHNCIRSNPYNNFLYAYKHLVVVGPVSLIKPWMYISHIDDTSKSKWEYKCRPSASEIQLQNIYLNLLMLMKDFVVLCCWFLYK